MDGHEQNDQTVPTPFNNASLLRRIAAAVYDTLLLIALLMVAAAAWLPITDGEAVPAGHLGFQLYLLSVIAVFFIGFWANGGQTLGMRAWRLKLLDADGHTVGLGTCALRFPLALLGWSLAGLGVLWLLVDRDGLALHDRLSGTRVVVVPKG